MIVLMRWKVCCSWCSIATGDRRVPFAVLAADVRQAVKDQLVDNFIYASVSPKYFAGVIDTL